MRRCWTGLLLVGALTLAGCTQAGDGAAGVRTSSPASTADAGTGPAPTPDPTAVAAAGLAPCPASGSTAPAGDLPDLTLPCLGAGPAVRLAGLRGTPLVLNVWASWCEPCRTELPILGQAQRAYGDRVRLLGINVADRNPDAALGLLAASGATYPSVVDWSSRTKAALRWLGPPMTALVRPDGTIAWRQSGEITSFEQLADLLRDHLGVTP